MYLFLHFYICLCGKISSIMKSIVFLMTCDFLSGPGRLRKMAQKQGLGFRV